MVQLDVAQLFYAILNTIIACTIPEVLSREAWGAQPSSCFSVSLG